MQRLQVLLMDNESCLCDYFGMLETFFQREYNHLEKYPAAHPEPFVIESVERMIKQLEQELELLKQAIETLTQTHGELVNNRTLLLSINGVGDVLSTLY